MKQLSWSPLLPLEPDWHALAVEASDAYFYLEKVKRAVAKQRADGKDYWTAHTRLARIMSVISCWHDEPALYGRLLARQQILKEQYQKEHQRLIVTMSDTCIPCKYEAHRECEGADVCACTCTKLPKTT